MISLAVTPEKGGTAVAISYRTELKEKRSVRRSNSSPRTCSGDIYIRVPSTPPGELSESLGKHLIGVANATVLSVGLRTSFANPKSRIFAAPLSQIKTLAGL